ncbi:MAG: hypothetical protein ACI9EF_002399 [Pseudohongiellaceae bacterium]|jgi:hypothetical protein
MRRLNTLICLCALLLSCTPGPGDERPGRNALGESAQPLPALQAIEAHGPAAHVGGTAVDTTGFELLTPEPITVPVKMFLSCRMQLNMVKRGPHFSPSVSMHANPLAAAALAASSAVMPVGSIVTKVKRWELGQTLPNAVASMIKREPGYDVEHGDWEYVYESLEPSNPRTLEPSNPRTLEHRAEHRAEHRPVSRAVGALHRVPRQRCLGRPPLPPLHARGGHGEHSLSGGLWRWMCCAARSVGAAADSLCRSRSRCRFRLSRAP